MGHPPLRYFRVHAPPILLQYVVSSPAMHLFQLISGDHGGPCTCIDIIDAYGILAVVRPTKSPPKPNALALRDHGCLQLQGELLGEEP
jgi:hypothetical protein